MPFFVIVLLIGAFWLAAKSVDNEPAKNSKSDKKADQPDISGLLNHI